MASGTLVFALAAALSAVPLAAAADTPDPASAELIIDASEIAQGAPNLDVLVTNSKAGESFTKTSSLGQDGLVRVAVPPEVVGDLQSDDELSVVVRNVEESTAFSVSSSSLTDAETDASIQETSAGWSVDQEGAVREVADANVDYIGQEEDGVAASADDANGTAASDSLYYSWYGASRPVSQQPLNSCKTSSSETSVGVQYGRWTLVQPYGSRSNYSRNVEVPIQHVRTLGRTNVSISMTKAIGTTMEMTLETGQEIVSYGFTAAVSSGQSYTLDRTDPTNSSRTIYRKHNYRRYKWECVGNSGGYAVTDARSWRPYRATTVWNARYAPRNFTCYEGNKQYFSGINGFTVARNTKFAWTDFFKIGGVFASNYQQNREDILVKKFTDAGGARSFTLCGSDDKPTWARDSKES